MQIYQELYKPHENKTAELDSLERNITEKITEEHILGVKKALLNLKPGKGDNVQGVPRNMTVGE